MRCVVPGNCLKRFFKCLGANLFFSDVIPLVYAVNDVKQGVNEGIQLAASKFVTCSNLTAKLVESRKILLGDVDKIKKSRFLPAP